MANHMGGPRSRQVWFEQMLPHIPHCAPDADEWISGKDLSSASGLSRHRRSAGMQWGRENFCPDRDEALVSGRRGYRFVTTLRQAASFVLPRAKSAGTLLRGSWLGAQKPLINRLLEDGELSPMEAKRIERTVMRALEDVDDLGALI